MLSKLILTWSNMYRATFTMNIQIYLILVISMTDVVYSKHIVARFRDVHVDCKTMLKRTINNEDQVLVQPCLSSRCGFMYFYNIQSFLIGRKHFQSSMPSSVNTLMK